MNMYKYVSMKRKKRYTYVYSIFCQFLYISLFSFPLTYAEIIDIYIQIAKSQPSYVSTTSSTLSGTTPITYQFSSTSYASAQTSLISTNISYNFTSSITPNTNMTLHTTTPSQIIEDIQNILDIDILKSFLNEFQELNIVEVESALGVNATKCPVGSFCEINATEPSKCAYCPKNLYTVSQCTLEGNAECNSTCPAGKYGTYYSIRLCVDCPIGTYKNKSGHTEPCISCPDGTFANTTGSTTCSQCPNGTFTTISSGYSNCTMVSF